MNDFMNVFPKPLSNSADTKKPPLKAGRPVKASLQNNYRLYSVIEYLDYPNRVIRGVFIHCWDCSEL